mgnify:CR=1 FL=1
MSLENSGSRHDEEQKENGLPQYVLAIDKMSASLMQCNVSFNRVAMIFIISPL